MTMALGDDENRRSALARAPSSHVSLSFLVGARQRSGCSTRLCSHGLTSDSSSWVAWCICNKLVLADRIRVRSEPAEGPSNGLIAGRSGTCNAFLVPEQGVLSWRPCSPLCSPRLGGKRV
jgi:hypothetical protein